MGEKAGNIFSSKQQQHIILCRHKRIWRLLHSQHPPAPISALPNYLLCMFFTRTMQQLLSIWKSPLTFQTEKHMDLLYFNPCEVTVVVRSLFREIFPFPNPVGGSFTANAWTYNVAIYTADTKNKKQPLSLP